MKLSIYSGEKSARRWTAGLWGLTCLSVMLAPLLATNSFPISSTAAYLFFSGICHQIPERSFWISGHPLAVCHRCTGVYVGLFLGSLIVMRWIHQSPRIRRNWVIAAIVPLFLDAILPYLGLWTNSPFSRFFTGLLFGTITSELLARGVAELFHETSWRRFLSSLHFKGGVS
jgi:uncharacterized membrane protein